MAMFIQIVTTVPCPSRRILLVISLDSYLTVPESKLLSLCARILLDEVTDLAVSAVSSSIPESTFQAELIEILSTKDLTREALALDGPS